jgi:hypothetical protein
LENSVTSPWCKVASEEALEQDLRPKASPMTLGDDENEAASARNSVQSGLLCPSSSH